MITFEQEQDTLDFLSMNLEAKEIESQPSLLTRAGEYTENFIVFTFYENLDLTLKVRVISVVTECVTTHA